MGQVPAADARAGGRDFQADRERRAEGPGGALPGVGRRRLHRRPRRQAPQPRGALRPHRHRQEDREPRRLLPDAAEAGRDDAEERGGHEGGVDRAVEGPHRARAQEGPLQVPQARDRAPGQFLEVLLQAEGLRGVPGAAAPRPRGDRGLQPSSSARSTRRRRRTPRSTPRAINTQAAPHRARSSASPPPSSSRSTTRR